MLATQLLCASLLLFLPHDPVPGTAAHDEGHEHAHVDPSWKRPAPSATPVYVGSGKHRYRWQSDWMQLPDGREFLGSTHGCIVVDREDRVYLSAETGPAVLVFTPDGKLERSFGEKWAGGLHGISIVEESLVTDEDRTTVREVLYLVHTGRQEVVKTTLTGDVLLGLEQPAAALYEDPASYRPTSVAVAPDGIIFVADGYGLSWIHRYDKDGKYLDSFGGPGDGPEHLRTPHGLWLETGRETPTLLVADRENHRLARFSLEGEYLGGTDPDSGLLRRPCHVQFLGKLGVVSDLAGRTTLIDSDLELVGHLGDNPVAEQRANFNVPPDQWREGAFIAPHCARFDSSGDLFVMDWNVAGRLTRLEHAPEPGLAPK